ncbi:MAG TPA: adenine phosphoribosyltransferase [Chthoniobacterales bacterium]
MCGYRKDFTHLQTVLLFNDSRGNNTFFSLMFGVVRSGSLLMSLVELERLQSAIRDITDFPKPGIIFKDITPILGDGKLFRSVIDHLAEEAEKANPTKVVGIDARGFLFGAAVAYKLGVGCVPIRKKGKLPYKTIGSSYRLEYGDAEVEMHVDAIAAGERVVLVDDLLATGGTSGAAVNLVQKIGGIVASALFVIELTFLHGREKLPPGVPVQSLVRF